MSVAAPSGGSAADRGGDERPSLGELTAVVPVRNADRLLPGCLASLHRNGVSHVVVVDGESTDSSPAVARQHGAVLLSDHGGGLPLARTLGVESASTPWVFLVDSDVVLPDGSVAALLEEFGDGGYDALQAGLHSVSGPGYWGQALTTHHLTGRSRWWFGLVATLVRRDVLLRHGFDDTFKSGEDIEIRWRLEAAGLKIGVSRSVLVSHRFAADDFEFAKDQFLMDGTGLGLMIRKHGWRGWRLAALPAAAAARGAALSVLRGEPKWLVYYGAYCWFNYVGVRRGLSR
jgi:glycosyltransferase involved in cell wall biosynthesis